MPDENPNQGFDLSSQKIGVPDDMHENAEAAATSPVAAGATDASAAAAQPEIAQIPRMEASADPEKGSFLHLISLSLKILWSKKFTFLFYALASVLIVAAIQIIAIPLLFVTLIMLGKYAIIVPIVIYAVTAFISYLFLGALAHQASGAYTKQKVNFGQSLNSTFKKTGKAIMVLLRTIFYSGLWIIFILFSLYAVLQILAGGSTFGASGPYIVMIGSYALGVASIIIMAVGSIRMVRMSLAFPKLMGDDFVSSKDAYEYSKTYTKGKWWMIVSSITAFSLLIGLVPLLFNLAGTLTHIALISQIASWINLFSIIIAYPLMLIFMQVLMHELGNPSRFYKANPWLVTLTILIHLTPVIVFAVMFILFPKAIVLPKIPIIPLITQTQETQETTAKVTRIKR